MKPLLFTTIVAAAIGLDSSRTTAEVVRAPFYGTRIERRAFPEDQGSFSTTRETCRDRFAQEASVGIVDSRATLPERDGRVASRELSNLNRVRNENGAMVLRDGLVDERGDARERVRSERRDSFRSRDSCFVSYDDRREVEARDEQR